MTASITTWDALERLDGPVLLVLNSRQIGDPAAAALWNEVAKRTSAESIYVAADRAWSSWIEERRIPQPAVRFAADRVGAPLEINYFLEQPETLRWVEDVGIQTIAGTAPHNLYNEEVQHVFERRVALLVGERGRLLAHTLPHRYLYFFGLVDLLDRMGRDAKIESYRSALSALVDDLHRLWTAHGQPLDADGGDSANVREILRAHLGEPVLAYDEESRVPLPSPSPSSAIAAFVNEVRTGYLRLAEDHAKRTAAVAVRDDAREFLRRLRGSRS